MKRRAELSQPKLSVGNAVFPWYGLETKHLGAPFIAINLGLVPIDQSF